MCKLCTHKYLQLTKNSDQFLKKGRRMFLVVLKFGSTLMEAQYKVFDFNSTQYFQIAGRTKLVFLLFAIIAKKCWRCCFSLFYIQVVLCHTASIMFNVLL